MYENKCDTDYFIGIVFDFECKYKAFTFKICKFTHSKARLTHWMFFTDFKGFTLHYYFKNSQKNETINHDFNANFICKL